MPNTVNCGISTQPHAVLRRPTQPTAAWV